MTANHQTREIGDLLVFGINTKSGNAKANARFFTEGCVLVVKYKLKFQQKHRPFRYCDKCLSLIVHLMVMRAYHKAYQGWAKKEYIT